MDMESVWKRIAAWHGTNCPANSFELAPGATTDQIDVFQNATRVELPGDVRLSYTFCNGGLYSGAMSQHANLCHFGEFLPLEKVLEQWQMYRQMERDQGYGEGPEWEPQDIEGPVDQLWNPPTRIPLTDSSGDHLMIDTATFTGTDGQVILHDHEVGPTKVLAPSWFEFLGQLADDLESGKYEYNEDEMTVCPTGMYD